VITRRPEELCGGVFVRAILGALGAVLLSASLASANDGYQTANGVAVYLGIMPASLVRGHPSDHEEGVMHDGAPSGPHQCMSRHGQPARRTNSIPLRKRRLSCDGLALRPRSLGRSSPMMAHSSSDKSPRAKAAS
jgi:hypothetical protein